jgi:hypothetical protein
MEGPGASGREEERERKEERVYSLTCAYFNFHISLPPRDFEALKL